jgi:hypothetical protein
MVKGRLPDEGPARLGAVTLPPGKPIAGDSGAAVAWATVEPVPESGQVWAALSALRPQTGLAPIQLDGLRADTLVTGGRRGLPGEALRPWDSGEFVRPEDPHEADRLNVVGLLRDRWRDWVPRPGDDDPELEEIRAPFDLEWPGLAPEEPGSLTPAERRRALDTMMRHIRAAHGATRTARIGLVAADRAADVLPVIGWSGLAGRGESLLPLTAVLRSWEDRFGAQLMDVGYADLRLLVDRPPRTLEAAGRVAAEHVVLADECIGGCRDIPGIAALLVNAPIWTFWWD